MKGIYEPHHSRGDLYLACDVVVIAIIPKLLDDHACSLRILWNS